MELARDTELDDGPAIRNAQVRGKLADWYVQQQGLKLTRYRTLTALSKGQTISWSIETPAKNCVNTDGAGFEDYQTVATVVQGKSSAKETVGKTDGWQCKA